MAYRVEVTLRAKEDLRSLYRFIDAGNSSRAASWFNGLERAILSLSTYPSRAPRISEDPVFRHLLYGNRRNVYRIIYQIDMLDRLVTVVHIRHGARRPFHPEES